MMNFLRKKMKTILITVAVIFAATMFYGLSFTGGMGGGGQSTKSPKGLAKVNGEEVDYFRYNQIVNKIVSSSPNALDPMSLIFYQSMALTQLIDFTIMKQGAVRDFGAGRDEIQNSLNGIMETNKIPDEKTFEQILKAQGFKLSDIKRMIKDEISVQKKMDSVRKSVSVGPDDLREVRAAHVLLATGQDSKKADEAMKKALDIRMEIAKGMDFQAAAKQYSDDRASAQKGGDLGFFKKGDMVKEFEDVAFRLKPGEVSDPVKTRFGWHIIKVADSRAIKNADKNKILEAKQAQAFNAWYGDLKAKAKVEIENPLLKAFDLRVKGDLLEADKQFKAAISAQPNNPYAHLFYADMLMQTGDLTSADNEFEKAAGLSSSDPYMNFYIGKAYYSASATLKGSTAEAFSQKALQSFKRASVLAGDNKNVREALMRFFKELKLDKLYSEEKARIQKIIDKEKFESEIRSRSSK